MFSSTGAQKFPWLHHSCILVTSWLHRGYIMRLHHGYIMVTSWLHRGYIVVTSWLHHGYIVVTSRLHRGYITVTLGLYRGYIVVTDSSLCSTHLWFFSWSTPSCVKASTIRMAMGYTMLQTNWPRCDDCMQSIYQE